MDFLVLDKLLTAFERAHVRYALIAEDKDIFGGKRIIKVLKPEDMIGLKVQAMVNDKARRNNDLGDIEKVMAIYGKELDWALIEEYFSLFGLRKIMKELREKYHAS